jgi:hypothetical protein
MACPPEAEEVFPATAAPDASAPGAAAVQAAMAAPEHVLETRAAAGVAARLSVFPELAGTERNS